MRFVLQKQKAEYRQHNLGAPFRFTHKFDSGEAQLSKEIFGSFPFPGYQRPGGVDGRIRRSGESSCLSLFVLCAVVIELEIVKWAHNPLSALLQDMSIHHGGGDVLVPQKSLNRANVCTPLEKMGGDPRRDG